jgi:hypothetical protein
MIVGGSNMVPDAPLENVGDAGIVPALVTDVSCRGRANEGDPGGGGVASAGIEGPRKRFGKRIELA